MISQTHHSVLFQETLDGLAPQAHGIYVDATFGRGGHSSGLLARLDPYSRLIAFDRDPDAVAYASKLDSDARFQIIYQPFAQLANELRALDLVGKVDGVMMDLGVSSPQLDNAERGFSFMHDGPLDMRMDNQHGPSVAEWLATAAEEDIASVIKTYGEEKFGKRIAHEIVRVRSQQAITTTQQLVAIIDRAMPVKDKHKHPATRTFQALRIFINDEFGQLEAGLEAAVKVLKPGGRLAVISFHSLEDRIVKRFMKDLSQGKKVPARIPIAQSEIDATKQLNLVGRAIKPSAEEIAVNPRARSSVLRVAEKR